MRRGRFIVLGSFAGLLVGGAITLPVLAGRDGARATRPRAANVQRAYGRLALRFEPNRGQTGAQVRFLARAPGSTVFLTSTGATLRLSPPAKQALPVRHGRARPARAEHRPAPVMLGLHVVGANPRTTASGLDRQPGVSNYLIGSDRSRWHTGIPGYGRVSYRSVYPGIDLSFYGRRSQLEYDFAIAPGADAGRIALALSGARALRLDRSGDLLLDTAAGVVRQRAPVIYQQVNGRRQRVPGGYVLKGHGRVGFRVDRYDHSRALVIDPVLSYGTYLGGSLSGDQVTSVAVDQSCASSCPAYVTGSTSSSDFPVKSALQGSRGGTGFDSDAFVAKLNADGSALEYSTYLGGSSADSGSGIAVDSSGRAFVTGSTSSAAGTPPAQAFPTTADAYQGAQAGSQDAFLAVLKPDGSALDYSTFLGGASSDSGEGVAVQGGKAYVTGTTGSADFPTKAALDGTCDTLAAPCASGDAFVAELDPATPGAGSLVYSTFLGGGLDSEEGLGIAADGTGAAYVTGNTYSNDFPTTLGAFQATLQGGGDAFVAKVKPNGSGLDYATHLGGSTSGASGAGIAIDPACASSCSAAVTGDTTSTDFPTTPGAYDATSNGAGDAFVTQLLADGSSLGYSTYLGGDSFDQGAAIGVRGGKAYVSGTTQGTDFPAKDPVERAQGPRDNFGDFDAFLSEFDPAAGGGASLIYSTRLGGNGTDFGQGVAVDGSGSAYVGAVSASARGDFPTTPGAFQPSFAGGRQDGFVAKISAVDPGLPYVSGVSPLSGSLSGGASVRVTDRGFGGATAVRFGGTPATSFTVDSSGEITAVSPAHPVGAAAVTVTKSAGTSPVNPITVFNYGEGSLRPTDPPSTLGNKPVVLKDGRVLVFQPTQFFDPEEPTPNDSTAQLYDPKTETWADTAKPTRLPNVRREIRAPTYTATLLANGKVLVTSASYSTSTADSAELYDPAGGGSWTNTTGPMSAARTEATATRLDGPACRGTSPPAYCGKVLIVGGRTPSGGANRSSTELYDPNADSFSAGASMKATRRDHGAVLLDDTACHGASPPTYCGKVLVAGGFDVSGNPLSSAELYDPAADTWSDAAPLNEFRARNNLVQLPDGRVLDPGGRDVAGNRVEDTELYDPATDAWTVTTNFPGQYPTIPTLLPNGKVLTIEASGGPRYNSGERTYLFDSALRSGQGDWVFAGIKPAAAQTAGAVLLSSDPLGLSPDPMTFKADAALCDANCGKALVVGAGDGAGFPAAVLGSAGLYTSEVPPASGGGPTAGGGPAAGAGGGSGSEVPYPAATPPRPASAPGFTLRPPAILRFRLTNNPFVVGGHRTPTFGFAAAVRRHKRGTTFTYTLSRPARARFVIARRRPGRLNGGRCVAPARRLRRAQRCTRIIMKGTLRRVSHRGANRVAFSGRIGSKRLSPGRYRVTLIASAGNQRSRPRAISFRIVKR